MGKRTDNPHYERQHAWYVANKEKTLARTNKRYQEGRDFLNKVKSVPCMDCKRMYDPVVMDFDHRPGAVKLGNVGRMGTSSLAKLKAEVAKCDVVCANCHRIRTKARLNGDV